MRANEAIVPSSGSDETSPLRAHVRAVKEAISTCGIGNEYPEYLEAGIMLHPAGETQYFHARPGQPFNRVVDISSHLDKKIDAIVACKSQGGGNSGSLLLRARLAEQGRSLPLLGNDDRTATREYFRQFLLDDYRQSGAAHNLT